MLLTVAHVTVPMWIKIPCIVKLLIILSKFQNKNKIHLLYIWQWELFNGHKIITNTFPIKISTHLNCNDDRKCSGTQLIKCFTIKSRQTPHPYDEIVMFAWNLLHMNVCCYSITELEKERKKRNNTNSKIICMVKISNIIYFERFGKRTERMKSEKSEKIYWTKQKRKTKIKSNEIIKKYEKWKITEN